MSCKAPASVPANDHAQIRFYICTLMFCVCKQQEYALVNIPFRRTFLSRLYEIYLSIKDLQILAEFGLVQILHLCTQTSV